MICILSIGWEELPQNDLFSVKWDVNPNSTNQNLIEWRLNISILTLFHKIVCCDIICFRTFSGIIV